MPKTQNGMGKSVTLLLCKVCRYNFQKNIVLQNSYNFLGDLAAAEGESGFRARLAEIPASDWLGFTVNRKSSQMCHALRGHQSCINHELSWFKCWF